MKNETQKKAEQTLLEKLGMVPEYLIKTFQNRYTEVLDGMSLKEVAEKQERYDYKYNNARNALKWVSIPLFFASVAASFMVLMFKMFNPNHFEKVVLIPIVPFVLTILSVIIISAIGGYWLNKMDSLSSKRAVIRGFSEWIGKIQYPRTETMDPKTLTQEAIGSQIQELVTQLLMAKKLFDLKSANKKWVSSDNVDNIHLACQFIRVAQNDLDEAWNRLQGFDAFKHLQKQSFFDRAKNDIEQFPSRDLKTLDCMFHKQ